MTPNWHALRSIARAGRTEQRLATPARIVLAAAAGPPNYRIAAVLCQSCMVSMGPEPPRCRCSPYAEAAARS
jgi:hypothetical protein